MPTLIGTMQATIRLRSVIKHTPLWSRFTVLAFQGGLRTKKPSRSMVNAACFCGVDHFLSRLAKQPLRISVLALIKASGIAAAILEAPASHLHVLQSLLDTSLQTPTADRLRPSQFEKSAEGAVSLVEAISHVTASWISAELKLALLEPGAPPVCPSKRHSKSLANWGKSPCLYMLVRRRERHDHSCNRVSTGLKRLSTGRIMCTSQLKQNIS